MSNDATKSSLVARCINAYSESTACRGVQCGKAIELDALSTDELTGFYLSVTERFLVGITIPTVERVALLEMLFPRDTKIAGSSQWPHFERVSFVALLEARQRAYEALLRVQR